MSKLLKFTPLESAQMDRVMAQDFGLEIMAKMAQEQIEGPYRDLVSRYREAHEKNKVREFLGANWQLIFAFLNDCGFIGFPSEKDKPDSYIMGAEAMTLISAYLCSKPKNRDAHEMQVIKNINLVAGDGSRKHASIFLEQQQVHDALREQLAIDLEAAKGVDFNKTYVIETFGTTGGNHVVCLTVRKKADEENPLVELFDPSPALVRNGFEAGENSIANGWCSQLIINATLKKVFAEAGLVFDNDKFFNNSEPLQRAGSSYCATFAYEAAHLAAKRSRAEHELILQRYKYPSPYGGKTEMPIDLDSPDEYVMNPTLALPVGDLAMSHFVSTALIPRQLEPAGSLHTRKDGQKETVLKRVARYQSEEDVLRPDLENQLAEQKVLRQRLHLFEMVTDSRFLLKAQKVSDVELASYKAQSFSGSPYFPKSATPDFVSQTRDLIDAFNKILPRFNRVNRSCYDDGKGCEVVVYLGEKTAQKLVDLMGENGVDCEVKKIDLSKNLVGVDKKLAQLQEVVINVPQEKFPSLVAIMNKMAEEKHPLYTAKPHPFMPPKVTKAELVAPLKENILGVKK